MYNMCIPQILGVACTINRNRTTIFLVDLQRVTACTRIRCPGVLSMFNVRPQKGPALR